MELILSVIETFYGLWDIYRMCMDALISIHPVFYIWDKIDTVTTIVGVITIIVHIISRERQYC